LAEMDDFHLEASRIEDGVSGIRAAGGVSADVRGPTAGRCDRAAPRAGCRACAERWRRSVTRGSLRGSGVPAGRRSSSGGLGSGSSCGARVMEPGEACRVRSRRSVTLRGRPPPRVPQRATTPSTVSAGTPRPRPCASSRPR
jgi:hypothetical protein